MNSGYVSYPGLIAAKSVRYTQTRGVTPDRIEVRMVPQTTALALTGDVTLTFGAESMILPDCLADKSLISMNDDGFIGSVVFQDRRWRWSKYPSVSYHFNERLPDNSIKLSSKVSLRRMIEITLLQLGETLFSAGAVNDAFYPEIDVTNIRPDRLLEMLTSSYGYSVSIGQLGDPVRIHSNGYGVPLPSSYIMSWSEAVNPPTPPAYVRVGFGPSVAQARFKLTSVGRDTDGQIKVPDSLSYRPSNGWENEPLGFPNVLDQHGQTAFEYASESVHRMFAITSFADGTLRYPDGSGVLSSINQVLPLMPKLLDWEVSGGQLARPHARVYGEYLQSTAPYPSVTSIDHRVDEPFTIDNNLGIVTFDKPMVLVYKLENYTPPNLYLEAAFRIKSDLTNQFVNYTKNILVNASGVGYHNVENDSSSAFTIVEYNADHGVTGTTTNQTILDAEALALASITIGHYSTVAAQMRWYSKPMFGIRVDGQTTQVSHVIDDENGHYTVAARSMEFDRFVRTEAEKRLQLHTVLGSSMIQSGILASREAKGND